MPNREHTRDARTRRAENAGQLLLLQLVCEPEPSPAPKFTCKARVRDRNAVARRGCCSVGRIECDGAFVCLLCLFVFYECFSILLILFEFSFLIISISEGQG